MLRYKILGELGKGGMGAVYRAQQLDEDRVVALKVLLPGGKNEERAKARFLREIEICMRLDHPHIIRVFDHGEADGQLFFTMQLIEGKSLHEVITRDGAQPPARVVELLAQMLDALDHCHKAGVVHRDVKPRNIMIGGEWHATLMDLGLIHMDNRTVLTEAGMLVGTPRYIAPESIVKAQYLPASDVFSLGVVAFEVATGKRPIGEMENVKDLLLEIVQGEPRRIREHVPDFPQELDDLVFRMMEKDPARRATVKDLLQDIAAIKGTGPRRRSTRGTRPLPARARLTRPVEVPSGRTGARSRWPAMALAMLLIASLGWMALREAGTPAAPVASVRPSASASSSPSPSPSASTSSLDTLVARVQDSAARVRRRFRIDPGSDPQLMTDMRSLKNESEVIPDLLVLAQDLQDMVKIADTSGLVGPAWLPVRTASLAALETIETFFSLHGRSSTLVARVKRLESLIRPDAPDPFRRCLSRTLQARIPLALNPSLWALESVAVSLVGCSEDLGRAEAPWPRSRAGVSLRIEMLGDAIYNFRHSDPISPEDFEERDPLSEELRGILPDLIQILPDWPDADVNRGSSAATMLTELTYLAHRDPGKGELPALVADAEKLAAVLVKHTWSEEDRRTFQARSRELIEFAKTAGLAVPSLRKLAATD